MHATDLDELDLKLIHALQIAPRVSWTDAGHVLGVHPQTLAGRWTALHDSGAAWITAHRGGSYRHHVTALVEVDCLAGRHASVVTAVCRDPRVVTVEESSQGHDLLLTVMTPDAATMTQFLMDDLPAVPGIAARRSYLATAVHRDGAAWRLGALTRTEIRSLERLTHDPTGADDPLPPDPWPLLAALADDGRRSAAHVAELTGRNASTVRRQIPRLIASGRISIRCDLAQSVSGSPVSCTWRARIAAADQPRTVNALRSLPQLRLCMSTTGPANLLITTWTTDLAQILDIERLLGAKLPWVELRDSAVNLRTPKRLGWLLDDDGFNTGVHIAGSA